MRVGYGYCCECCKNFALLQITKLQKQSTKLKEREMVQEQFNNKEKQLTVLQNKHRSTLTELLGQMPEKNFAMSVKKVEVETQSEVEGIKKKLKDNKNEVRNCFQLSTLLCGS